MKQIKSLPIQISILLIAVASFNSCSTKNIAIDHLTVEYSTTPLGIDVVHPRFGWQMLSGDGERGIKQNAYQIIVKDTSGSIVWDSKKVKSTSSVAIPYEGSPLEAVTRFIWSLNVWDQDEVKYTADSWFETGLMNSDPDLSAWDGAQWIGGSDEDLVLFSQYQLIFRMKCSLAISEGSSRAGFIYGANDLRLMDINKNIIGLENKENESYIKVELDISGVDGSNAGLAKLNIYRVGYTLEDKADEPFASFDVKSSVIHTDNKHDPHVFEFSSAFGLMNLILDGENEFFVENSSYEPARIPYASPGRDIGAGINLNPFGIGGDYLPYGNVCDIGFFMEAGQKATCSHLEISNDRLPGNTLFKEDLGGNYGGVFASQLELKDGAFQLDGGERGSMVTADPSRNSAPMLRTEFEAEKSIGAARLYVTSRGIYEVYINGKRVGDDYYNPGLTQYNKTHMYQTYDVSGLLTTGENVLGAMLAEGWWSGLLSFTPMWNHWGDRQSLLAKLVIEYSDGSEEIITTNESDWKFFSDGPIVYSSLSLGEIYDATKETGIEGWSSPGYDDTAWKRASKVPLEATIYTGTERAFDGTVTDLSFEHLQLTGQIGNNAGVFTTLSAQSVKEVRKGIFVYDMGQNFVGVPRITITNGRAGDTLMLRVSEMLYPDLEESGDLVGMVMTENYRAALCKDIYIMKDGAQVFQPRFTSRGYQYIEVSGMEEALPLQVVQGVALSSVLELTADYKTSNEKVNQLWSNLVWSNVDNFLSIPTDCPQRNERMGWSGDISVFSRTASYVSRTAPFFRRHMLAMRDTQRPKGKFADVAPVGGGFGGILWGSAGITVPWEVYLQYNDLGLLEEHYDAMVAYQDHLESTISEKTGIIRDGQLGDWLGPQNLQTGTPILTTAYHVYDLWIMTQVAQLLGRSEDAARFSASYEQRKTYFNDTYINEDGLTLKTKFKVADTQTSYAVGLALGAFSEENVPRMAARLAEAVSRQNLDDKDVLRPEYSLMTGFIGTAWISKALSDNGYIKEAYKLLHNNQYPSWLYAIDQGATTIWERLNGYTVENGFGGNNRMNSFNHYSFGAVGQWMMAHSLGIQRDEPGFQKFILQPEPDPSGEMTWAEGWYDSMYGRIKSRWAYRGNLLVYEATVPPNTIATLYLPASSAGDVRESGLPAKDAEGIKFVKYENGKAVYKLLSGTYTFETYKNTDYAQ